MSPSPRKGGPNALGRGGTDPEEVISHRLARRLALAALFEAEFGQRTAGAILERHLAETGADPRTEAKLRVEAAAWRGRPVSFRIVGPWTVPARMEPPDSGQSEIAWLAIIYLVILSSHLMM